MKRKVARLRLSPNEEAQLIREEHERRRKLRIQQVREQERYIALQIRTEVQQRRERELQNLAEELKEEWERQQREKLDTLRKLYQDNLRVLGEGHRSAKENEPDWEAIALKNEENHVRADERYREALKELKSQRQKDQEEQNRFIEARKKAIQVEKERASKVANLPSLPPNPIENIESRKLHAVKKSDVDAFSVTHYHMPETAVDREVDTAQPNAQEVAVEETLRLQELGQEEQRERREQLEKARLRGNHALRREQLTQDRERLLVELEHMHQTDLLRRRQVMAQMPAQIFQPLHKRQEMREDWQRDMEFAFEDMYTGERRVKGDLVLQLVPEPLPAVSTGSQDEDLDLTLEEATPELTPLAGAEEQPDEEPSRPLGGAPRQALKKLLTRIRSQRDHWSYRRLVDPPSDRQTTPTAECNTTAGGTTIETGSLASEERGRPLTTSPRLPDPSQPAQAIETTEESIVAGTLLHPDKQAMKIHTFETERRRREEELERQKQEQIVLLQELEEKKSRLELLLQEAQQEREQLQTAKTQDTAAASGTQKTPAQDVSPAAPTPESTVPSAAEDDHSRRIKDYQQHLFDKNRLHKQSVEEARRRLEEYQRTLRNRYSGVTTSTRLPPGTTARPLPHFREIISPTVPLELPYGSALLPCLPVAPSTHSRAHTPLDLPTREPSILAQTLFRLGTAVGSHINSRTSPVQLEPTAESLRDQRAGVWLADNVFSRVTEDLPGRLPPPSTSLDPQSYRPHPVSPHPTPHIPLPSRTDPIPAISPILSEESATLPVEAPVNPGPVLRAPARFGGEVERQELREAQRRVEAQREVIFMQQRELEEEQRERRRRQREALQPLLTADDTQPGPETADGLGSEVLGSERLRLMAALLRAIEESNGQASPSVEANQSQDDKLGVQSSHPDRPAPHPLPHHHPRAAKPPVAHARLAVMEMMTEQHELSAIQEVETPANASLITEESVTLFRIERAVPEDQDRSAHSERGHSGTSVSSAWEHTAGTGTGSETVIGSGRSSKLSWRERLRLEAGASPEPDPTPALPEQSYHSCEFGRSVPGKSPTELESVSLQSAHRPSEPDYLSSTTISSGSYATTDPEHTSTQIDSSLLLAGFGIGGGGGENKKSLTNGSFSSRHSSCREVSGPGPPSLDSLLHSSSIQRIIDKYTRELNLSFSTAGNQTGPPSVIEGSVCEEPSSSVSQQKRQQKPWSKLLQENEGPDGSPVWGADPHSLLSDTESGAQRHNQEWDNSVNRIMDHLSDKSSSLVLDKGRDSTISPMIGQPSDKSSSPGQGWDSTLSRMIGQLSGQSTSLDQGWDSTLSRMIGGLSNQSTSVSQLIGQMRLDQSSQWLDEGQDESQMMRPLVRELDESAAQWSGSSGADGSNSLGWVDLRVSGQTGVSSDPEGVPEAQSLSSSSLPGLEPQPHPHYQILQHSGDSSQEADRTGVDLASDSFHPLLAEVTNNEKAEPSIMTFHLPEEEVEGPWSSGADGSNSLGWVDLSGSGQTGVSSVPEGAPEAQSLSSSSLPGLAPQPHPHYQILQHSGASSQEADRTGVDPASDSFHPLLAEVTHNETAEPSMTFHLPEEEVKGPCSHDEESDHEAPAGDLEFSACSEEFEDDTDPSVTSEPSPERLRGGEEPPQSSPAVQDSLNQLTTSQCLPHDSALEVSPGAEEVGLAACALSDLSLCEDVPTLDMPLEGGDTDMESTPAPHRVDQGGAITIEDLGAGEPDAQLCSESKISPPTWERIMVGSVKGIMDESMLTLVSLTDTTLQDQELTEEEEGETEVSDQEDAEKEGIVEKESESTVLPEDTSLQEEETTPSHAVMLLEFQSCPSVNLQEAFQQKRRALIQRSARRVEEIQAKRAEARAKANTRAQSDTTETRANTTTRAQSDPTTVQSSTTKPRREGRSAESTHARGDAKQKKQQPKSQTPLQPPMLAKLKKVGEVRISTPEMRKQDVTEMHQRTERLYSRLDEVKLQKEVRSRQEAYAKNREKAKEFHKKTLQKLRAKQSYN
ncbi:centrosomal protein of 295 kDa isoform X1 [Coregonus clupeaformis]|uniref:centrosomal protein of 295 kDa isoform X1 n=1 Tax=Coregonus clupeaformis TaxID=59861 RepID=UPI001E1C5A66|nr:centrosomal protein of 295 kDa isoform X1 [Coregonus clupeaformis]